MVEASPAERPVSPAPRRWGEYVGLSAGSAALIVGAALAAWILSGMFAASHRTFGWIVACGVVALLIDPVVAALDRHVPRPIAVVLVLLGVLGAIIGLGVGIAREVVESLDELRVEAPAAAAELESQYSWAADLDLERRVATAIEQIDAQVREGAVSEAADALPAYLVTAILMLFLLATGRRYIDGLLDQFAEPRRSRLRHVVVTAGRRGRRWILGALAHALLVGSLIGAVAWLFDLPAAVSLGVLVGMLSVLPLIGILVGGVPAVLLAFGLEGWPAAVVIALLLFVLQVVEAAFVRRRIEARSVHVGPAVPLVVGLLGFELYGIGGSIYGIALAVLGLAALDAAGQEVDEADAGDEADRAPDPSPGLGVTDARSAAGPPR